MPDETPPPTPPEPIWASLQIKRGANGKMMLHVEARELHDRLIAMGAMLSDAGRFLDAPNSNFDVTDRRTLATQVFLKREYPASFAIGEAWSTPPTLDVLANVCATGEAVVKRILAHYTPVDIKLKIKKG